eukprot:3179678-Prorocentrum_lima.AAC.1
MGLLSPEAVEEYRDYLSDRYVRMVKMDLRRGQVYVPCVNARVWAYAEGSHGKRGLWRGPGVVKEIDPDHMLAS